MTEAQKVRRLRSLARRIEKATGNKRKMLKREYDFTQRSLGRMIWVSTHHNGHGSPVPFRVGGTYKKNDR